MIYGGIKKHWIFQQPTLLVWTVWLLQLTTMVDTLFIQIGKQMPLILDYQLLAVDADNGKVWWSNNGIWQVDTHGNLPNL